MMEASLNRCKRMED